VTAPLPAGQSITLTSGGDYFFPNFSSAMPLPVGVEVYGLVDSINFATSYGAVDESNEANNLFGAITSTGGGVTAAASGDTITASSVELPAR
jgi:hypothetical protein